MTTTDQFAEVLRAEADLADALLGALNDEQQAILRLRNGDLLAAVERQQRLLLPMEGLERERIKLCRTMGSEGKEVESLSGIAAHMPPEEAAPLLRSGQRLRAKAETILAVSGQNRMLLENSLRFVKHTLRLVTEDYSRKLVDTTM